MREFTEEVNGTLVRFGWGRRVELAALLTELGCDRPLLLSTPGRQAVASALLDAPVFAGAREHVPVECADAARARARAMSADAVVAIGGGSAVGLAKAVALTEDVLHVAVPTTYAGSEMTAIWGMTADGGKRTGTEERVRARGIVYDAELGAELPIVTSAVSLFNAMAHAVEAHYAAGTTAALADLGGRSLSVLAPALDALIIDPSDREARDAALYGAFLAGRSLAAGVALHHKLCHVLGGSFGLPHAQTHAVILPHAVRYNEPAAREAIAAVAVALGVDDAAIGLFRLLQRSGAPTDLAALGLPAAELERAAQLACASPYPNPRALDEGAILALLRRAHAGEEP